MVNKDYRLSS